MNDNITQISGALAEFRAVDAGIAEMRSLYSGVVYDVATTDGMASARAARAAIRGPRYRVEQIRKAAKAPVLALGRQIDDEAKRITAELEKLEQPIDQQIKAEEDRKEAERQAKIAAEERAARAAREAADREAAERQRQEREAMAARQREIDAAAAAERQRLDAERRAHEAAAAAESKRLAAERDELARREEALRKAAEPPPPPITARARPSDSEILAVICRHFGVDAKVATSWLGWKAAA